MDIVDFSKVNKHLKKLPSHILTEFRIWVQTIETAGLRAMRIQKRYRDHLLKGNRKGQRASCFGRSYRVIYEVHKSGEINIIKVEKVTNHDYRKK